MSYWSSRPPLRSRPMSRRSLGQLGIDAAADRPGRALDRGGELGRGHRSKADLAVLDGGAQRVVHLDVGVEVGAGAEDQGAGRLGGGIQHEVDEQAGVGGAALVFVGLGLARLGLGIEFFPLVDIEEEAGGAGVVLEAVADELGEQTFAGAGGWRRH